MKLKIVKGNVQNALLELNKLNKKGNLLEKLFDQFCDYLCDDCSEHKTDYVIEITCDNIIENINYIANRFCKWMSGEDDLCSSDIIIKM